jgi:palmitoyltransferase
MDSVLDRLLALVYCGIMSAAWTAVFSYVYPWIDRQQQEHMSTQIDQHPGDGGGASSSSSPIFAAVPMYHKYLGYAVFAACGISWRWASTVSPGIITPKSLKRYDHYPYDGVLFLPGIKCPVTRTIPKLARSKYDRHRYHRNVARFDHYCGWVYNTIGEENYRFFLLFLLVHAGACGYGTHVLCKLFRGEIQRLGLSSVSYVDRATGVEYRPTRWIVVQFLFHNYLWESSLLLLTGVMTIALGAFLLYHCYLTSVNMTTNEAYKWGQVKSWHRQELKRYRLAVKSGSSSVVGSEQDSVGLSNPSLSQTKSSRRRDGNYEHYADSREHPVVDDDLDVTCAGGATGSSSNNSSSNGSAESMTATYTVSRTSQSPERQKPLPVRHPGPYPRNLYDRGFFENWKEVLFPLSLRPVEDRLLWFEQRNPNRPRRSSGKAEESRGKPKMP